MLTLHAIYTLTLVKALIAVPAFITDQHGEPLTSNALSTVPDKCDYYCTRNDLPACAGNGQCLQRFKSECAMKAYNCKHPLKPFEVIKDALCEQRLAPFCKSNELGHQ